MEMNATRYKNCKKLTLTVSLMTAVTPTGPESWSTPTCPLASCPSESQMIRARLTDSQNAYSTRTGSVALTAANCKPYFFCPSTMTFGCISRPEMVTFLPFLRTVMSNFPSAAPFCMAMLMSLRW